MSIAVRQLNFVYNPKTPSAKQALTNVNLNVKDGEFLCIVGHTGSGKSTFVQHLNALVPVQSGFLEVNGLDLTLKKKKLRREMLKKLRGQVGMVFQYPEYQLFASSVEADVAFGPQNMKLTQQEIDERVREAIKAVGLEFDEVATKSPFELSGGQKRRVAIAGVLAMRPKVLVLDEPTAGLDPKGRDEILDQVERLHKETGMTVILVSHSMEDVARYVERIIVLNRGEKMLDGTPREVFRHYKELEKVGLAAPQVTYVMHELKERGFDLPPDATTIKEAADEIMRSFQ